MMLTISILGECVFAGLFLVSGGWVPNILKGNKGIDVIFGIENNGTEVLTNFITYLTWM